MYPFFRVDQETNDRIEMAEKMWHTMEWKMELAEKEYFILQSRIDEVDDNCCELTTGSGPSPGGKMPLEQIIYSKMWGELQYLEKEYEKEHFILQRRIDELDVNCCAAHFPGTTG